MLRFTAPQAELYEAVLEIQKACLTLCSPGTSLENIYSMMLTLMGQKLKDLGIIKTSKESAFKVPPSLFTPALQNSQQHATQFLPCLVKLIIGLGHSLAVLCKMDLALTWIKTKGVSTYFCQKMAAQSDSLLAIEPVQCSETRWSLYWQGKNTNRREG